MALKKEDPIPFESWEQVAELKKTHNREQQISFNCERCGKPYSRSLRFISSLNCKQCLGDLTAIEKYGSVEEMQRQNIEHGKKTKKERYGDENYVNIEQQKATLQAKYGEGVTCPSKIPGHKDRIVATSNERYGVDNYSQTEESKEKVKKTSQIRYGVDNYSQTDEARKHASEIAEQVQEKRKATLVERYGHEYFPVENLGEKIRATCQEKYGCDNYAQTEECKRILSEMGRKRIEERHKKGLPIVNYAHYKYKGYSFDSLWELEFYLYHELLGHSIKREPIALSFEYNGKEHNCYPDFEVDGQLYEVKGEQFFMIKEGKEVMCNPYNHNRDGVSEASHQCMLRANVKYIRINEIKEIERYIYKVYDKDFTQRFKINIPSNSGIKP